MKSPSCLLLVVITVGEAQVIPLQIQFSLTSQSVNGSSATGNCTNATRLSNRYQCDNPTSSVVYDGHIPSLTGLDGNMWASQLLTINANRTILVFVFSLSPNFQVRRVEMVVFNCPEWGISVQSVALTSTAGTPIGNAVNTTLSSCDSLVRLCIPISFSQTALVLVFTTVEPTDWVHIAEVGFYNDSPTCPEEAITTTPTTARMPISTPTTNQAGPDATTVSMTQCPSCSTSTTLASVITVIITALLATLIFVLLQIALYKYHPKFAQRQPKSAAMAEGEEIAVYEKVDGGDEGVAVSDHTYMEVGARERNTIVLKENEAYGGGIGSSRTS